MDTGNTGTNKSYLRQHFEEKEKVSRVAGPLIGVTIGTVFLIVFFIWGARFIDWATLQSRCYISDSDLQRRYINERHSVLYHMRERGEITDNQFDYMVDSMKVNARRDYFEECKCKK